jgi:hypothetical protein
MLFVGTPQPVSIASTITDWQGRFIFATTKDRGRFLEIRLARRRPADFRSRSGFAVEHLHDSQSPGRPQVSFNSWLIHNGHGGFREHP